jgi:hypothetical protein
MPLVTNSDRDTVDLKSRLFGKIDNRRPLNCQSCGSKNLRYIKSRGLKAVCCDCGGSFKVSRAIAPYIDHLAERAKRDRNIVDWLLLFAPNTE